MKIYKRNMGRYVLFLLSLLIFIIPSVINMVQAGVRDELIKSINLVKTKGDIVSSASVVTNNQIYDQKENKYYIKIDWDEASVSQKIKPNDEYIIDVKGVLLENMVSVQDLLVHISGNPPTLLSKIGEITVLNNKIKIVFNSNVDSETVNSYGDLDGTIYVRTSVDYNNYIGQTSIQFEAYVNDVLRKELALKHEDLTPKVELLVDIRDGKGFVPNITNVIPSDVVDAKLSVTPKKGYIINFLETDFSYNDYSLDFFTGPHPGNPAAPSWGDDHNLDYTYTRTTGKPRRSETTKAEKLASNSTWEFRTKTTKEFTDKTDLLFKIYINHLYTDNDFQAYNYHIVANTIALYKIEKFNEVISISEVNKVKTTDVIVRFVDDKGKPIISDLPFDNVPLTSTEYFNYVVKQTELDAISAKGYEPTGKIDQLNKLSSTKGSNIIVVHCKLKQNVGTTNVIVKFVYDKNPTLSIIPNLIYDNVPLDSLDYYNFHVVNPYFDQIIAKGYVIVKIDQLTSLSPIKDSNIIVVHCDLKTNVEVTDVIVRFINKQGTNIIPDLKWDNVPLNSTDYFNYVVNRTEAEVISARGYTIIKINQLVTLKPAKGSNIILIHCDLKTDVKTTDVIVRFVDKQGNTIIPDLKSDNVPLTSTDYYNYVVNRTESDALSSKGYVVVKIDQLVSLSPNKGSNIILVHCDLKTNVKTTDVIVRFIYDKVTPNIKVIPDLTYDPVYLNSTEYFNYVVKNAQLDDISYRGYVVTKVQQLNSLSTTKGTNIILVYCDLKTVVTTSPPSGGGGGGGGGVTVITPSPSGSATPQPTITPSPTTVIPVETPPQGTPITPEPTDIITITSAPPPLDKPSMPPKVSTPPGPSIPNTQKPNPITNNDLTFVKASFITIAFLGVAIILKLKKSY